MPYKQVSFEQGAANQIQGHFKTLDNARRASMQAHNRHVQSVHELAEYLAHRVNELRNAFPRSQEVVRWARKFDTYVKQHNLL